ncbi:unnamed protein product [Pleuronectes platessa]|uniref:Uncharacterized protein n=1 Tax=Pleuronectes platessa TaxID=8262 RepID=A0A9N7YLD0_PLEPL|nr:unnamed protein product [Pleuronectes platessa]
MKEPVEGRVWRQEESGEIEAEKHDEEKEEEEEEDVGVWDDEGGKKRQRERQTDRQREMIPDWILTWKRKRDGDALTNRRKRHVHHPPGNLENTELLQHLSLSRGVRLDCTI